MSALHMNGLKDSARKDFLCLIEERNKVNFCSLALWAFLRSSEHTLRVKNTNGSLSFN